MVDPLLDRDPLGVPRRLVFRLCADVLFSQAERLRKREPARSGKRRGPGAWAGAAEKAAGRRAVAAGMEAHGKRLRSWATDDDTVAAGPSVDAAIVGYLVAWLAGAAEMWRELDVELTEQYGRSPLPSMDKHDLSAVVRAVSDACVE